jgi:protein tyrosine phosphatase
MICEDNANLILTNNNAHLWLGNRKAALDFNLLKDNNITVIINCTKEIPFIHKLHNNTNKPFKLETIRIPIYDSDHESDNNELYKSLEDLMNFLDIKFINEKRNILIHCAAGVSRSASVAAAYIFYTIKYNDKGYSKKNISDCQLMHNVIAYIVKRRPCTFYYGSKLNFKNALQKYFNITFNYPGDCVQNS